MPEVIVFPDIEDLLVAHLNTQLPLYGMNVPASVQIPNPRPDTFVTVPRVGGPRRNLVVDTPTVSLESWALRPKLAFDLAQAVRGIVGALAGQKLGGHQVYRVSEFTGPGNLPDSVSSHARYTQSVSIQIRGSVLEPVEP